MVQQFERWQEVDSPKGFPSMKPHTPPVQAKELWPAEWKKSWANPRSPIFKICEWNTPYIF
jgi:hypothetical protein